MITDKQINSSTAKAGRKYPNLRQLDFNRQYLENKIEKEIADYERFFADLSKDEHPTQWYYVQMELAELYRRLNLKVKHHPGRFTIEIYSSLINEDFVKPP